MTGSCRGLHVLCLKDKLISQQRLQKLLGQVRACRECEAHLPFEPNPVVRASTGAKLLIVGQAPGTRVNETGIPWNDRFVRRC